MNAIMDINELDSVFARKSGSDRVHWFPANLS